MKKVTERSRTAFNPSWARERAPAPLVRLEDASLVRVRQRTGIWTAVLVLLAGLLAIAAPSITKQKEERKERQVYIPRDFDCVLFHKERHLQYSPVAP